MAGDNSVASLHRVLVDRCLSLEASHVKLREEFDEIVQLDKRSDEEEVMVASDSGDSTSYPVFVTFPGYFSTGTPFKNVLDSVGHAIHVSSTASGRITFWYLFFFAFNFLKRILKFFIDPLCSYYVGSFEMIDSRFWVFCCFHDETFVYMIIVIDFKNYFLLNFLVLK